MRKIAILAIVLGVLFTTCGFAQEPQRERPNRQRQEQKCECECHKCDCCKDKKMPPKHLAAKSKGYKQWQRTNGKKYADKRKRSDGRKDD